MLANGYHNVPPGKLAVIITYLEMRSRATERSPVLPEGVAITQAENPDPDWYRDLFRRVGGTTYLWFSRLRLDDAELSAILKRPNVEIHSVEVDGRSEGLAELNWHSPTECEIEFFGLTDALIGKGVGRALMDVSIARAWSKPIKRLHLQTCTADSPQALAFYMRSGFTPVRQSIEIADDPRLTGVLPRSAGPRIPIFEPSDTE